LQGVRVIDLTTLMSGPSAIMIQGNFEAEIIEVEKHAAGDASRNIPRYLHEGESVFTTSA